MVQKLLRMTNKVVPNVRVANSFTFKNTEFLEVKDWYLTGKYSMKPWVKYLDTSRIQLSLQEGAVVAQWWLIKLNDSNQITSCLYLNVKPNGIQYHRYKGKQIMNCGKSELTSGWTLAIFYFQIWVIIHNKPYNRN